MPDQHLTYAQYDALPGVRSGDLNRLARSPLHYREQAGSGDTLKRRLERAIHALMLEQESFAEQFVVYRGKRGKEFDAWKLCNEGRTVLTPAAWDKAHAIARTAYLRPASRQALWADGESELPIQWIDEETGLACKGRIDRLNRGHERPWLIDLKAYGTSDPREIARRAVTLGSHVQLAHYHAGLLAATGIDARVMILSIETAPPYDAALVELEPDGALGQGYVARDRLMGQLVECHAAGQFPGRCEQIVPLELPTYGRPEVGADEDGLDVDLDDTDQEMP